MMEGRYTGKVQGKVDGLEAPVHAGSGRCFEVLRYKGKANVGVRCPKEGVLKECLLLNYFRGRLQKRFDHEPTCSCR